MGERWKRGCALSDYISLYRGSMLVAHVLTVPACDVAGSTVADEIVRVMNAASQSAEALGMPTEERDRLGFSEEDYEAGDWERDKELDA